MWRWFGVVTFLCSLVSTASAHWGLEHFQVAQMAHKSYTAEERLLILKALFLGSKNVPIADLISGLAPAGGGKVKVILRGGVGSFYESGDGLPAEGSRELYHHRSDLVDGLILAHILRSDDGFGKRAWHEAGAQEIMQLLEHLSTHVTSPEVLRKLWSPVLVAEFLSAYLESNSPTAFQLFYRGRNVLWAEESHYAYVFWASDTDGKDLEQDRLMRFAFFEPDRMKIMNVVLGLLAIKLGKGLEDTVSQVHQDVGPLVMRKNAAKLIPYFNLIMTTPEFLLAAVKERESEEKSRFHKMAQSLLPLMKEYSVEALVDDEIFPIEIRAQRGRNLHRLAKEIHSVIFDYVEHLPFSRCEQVL